MGQENAHAKEVEQRSKFHLFDSAEKKKRRSLSIDVSRKPKSMAREYEDVIKPFLQ